MQRIVTISDHCDVTPSSSYAVSNYDDVWDLSPDLLASETVACVTGGYLDRLPLSAVAVGLADAAEVWSFAGTDDPNTFDSGRLMTGTEPHFERSGCGRLARRVFRADAHGAPYGSEDALAYIRRYGAPEILCVWGLGVDERLLTACSTSIKVYNSIDAPAIRIPAEVSCYFDIFLTGAHWQSDEIRARHPGALCSVLPIGPEFASDITFYPTGAPKDYDVVYVAATQEYKRHNLLLDTLAQMPHLRALCIVGYGHLTDALKAEAKARGLSVDWVGPFDHDTVNQWINRARVGLVCGIDDGAPAILTEYMLAGLPVLANAALRCGLHYIRPDTGISAPENRFAEALHRLLARTDTYDTRAVVQKNWTWPHSIARFADLLTQARARRDERILA